MPGFDRSGPMGAGPMTGWARGYCNTQIAGSERPWAETAGFGRGMRRRLGFRDCGRGMGRFYGRGLAPSPQMQRENADDELMMLKQQAESLKNTLNSIEQKISDLEK